MSVVIVRVVEIDGEENVRLSQRASCRREEFPETQERVFRAIIDHPQFPKDIMHYEVTDKLIEFGAPTDQLNQTLSMIKGIVAKAFESLA